MAKTKISSLNDNINKNIQITVSDIDSDKLMTFETLPVKNSIIISAPKQYDENTLSYIDSGIFSILMTDFEGRPIRLTRHINMNGFKENNGQIELNVDNDSLCIENNLLKFNQGYLEKYIDSLKLQAQINELNAKLNQLINGDNNKLTQNASICVNDYNNVVKSGEYIPYVENSPMYLIIDDIYYENNEIPSISLNLRPNSTMNAIGPETNIKI